MYVEGYVLPVKTARKDDYVSLAKAVGEIFIEYGATRMVECWGADVPPGKVTDFQRSVALEEDETVVFSWMEFPDKATRDRVMDASMNDPRMEQSRDDTLIDGRRMIFAGFEKIVDLSA